MDRRLAFLLLIGAILGLLGQESAFAQMTLKPVQSETTQMDPDCAKAMGITVQPSSDDQPCQGMTPECIAKMGCTVPLALLPGKVVDDVQALTLFQPVVSPVAALFGRTVPPEPEPPAHIG
ncbi:hypothetical protein [Novosphingobium sp. NDB2Meth1]|uniref:hypothetical protein n=1 Tax=Novosphingobium sp. NDB2Meth1 TaxID=1892847 RepID=UPI000930C271|nr:hypothetical protein [Novosphingobium sp. NDB2Meth1]